MHPIVNKSPKETKHILKLILNGIQHKCVYEITGSNGLEAYTPSPDEPILFLRVAGRYAAAPPYMALQLTEFLKISKPLEKSDLFYDFTPVGDGPGQPSEAEIKRSNVR